MPEGILIRKATQKDAALLETLASEIWTQHYITIISAEQIAYMLSKFQSADAIAEQIESGTIYHIAFCENIPCGYSAFKLSSTGLFISKLYVKEAYRGRGLAREMISLIDDFAKQALASRIWLICNKNNAGSLSAYRRLGFSIIDEAVTNVGNGFVMDDYVLEKPISFE